VSFVSVQTLIPTRTRARMRTGGQTLITLTKLIRERAAKHFYSIGQTHTDMV
jgi:hypothetical protein